MVKFLLKGINPYLELEEAPRTFDFTRTVIKTMVSFDAGDPDPPKMAPLANSGFHIGIKPSVGLAIDSSKMIQAFLLLGVYRSHALRFYHGSRSVRDQR